MKPWFMIGIIAVVIAIAIVGVVISNIMERKRREALRALAADLSFEFFDYGQVDLLAALSPFALFGLGRSRSMRNLMRGAAGGIELDIFDYRYVIGSGKNQQTVNNTVLSVQAEDLNLPSFSLRPETFWSKIGSMLGYQDIGFDSHPKFSKLYRLKGSSEFAVREIFRPDVLDYFEQHPKLNVEGFRGRLIYFVPTRLAVDKIRDFMNEGFAILSLFRNKSVSAPPEASSEREQGWDDRDDAK